MNSGDNLTHWFLIILAAELVAEVIIQSAKYYGPKLLKKKAKPSVKAKKKHKKANLKIANKESA